MKRAAAISMQLLPSSGGQDELADPFKRESRQLCHIDFPCLATILEGAPTKILLGLCHENSAKLYLKLQEKLNPLSSRGWWLFVTSPHISSVQFNLVNCTQHQL